VDDDVGEVDRSTPVPFSTQHRRGQQLDRRRGFAGEVHVGQAADKADVGLSGGELAEGGPDGQLGLHPELSPDVTGHEPVQADHVRRQESDEAYGISGRCNPVHG
jgi:hypothetical protein